MIKKERSCLKKNNLKVKLLSGKEIQKEHWNFFYNCYLDTTGKKWGSSYLTKQFEVSFENIDVFSLQQIEETLDLQKACEKGLGTHAVDAGSCPEVADAQSEAIISFLQKPSMSVSTNFILDDFSFKLIYQLISFS